MFIYIYNIYTYKYMYTHIIYRQTIFYNIKESFETKLWFE